MERINETLFYVIDKNDMLTDYSENFMTFAISNGWKPESEIIGRNIFDFIEGIEVRHIYRTLFDLTRQGKHIGPIPFRCDSPTSRRFMELFFTPGDYGSIRITSKISKIEHRKPINILFMTNVERSQKFLRMCSICKKIDLGKTSWVEIEEGLVSLGIFISEKPFKITHGLCPGCFNLLMSEIEKYKSI